MTPSIPQRELRNDVSAILRRVEAGERFTVTVNGRPVAELAPTAHRPLFADPEVLRQILKAPVDGAWAQDLASQRAQDDDSSEDPWATG